MFRSDDAGATWTRVSENRDVRQRAFYYSRVYADPKDKDTVYAPNVDVHEVDRRRQDVEACSGAARRQPRHVDRPDEPEALHRANDGGATVTINGGQTWTTADAADRAVLPRDHDERRAVPRVRRAAGQQRRCACRAAGGERLRRGDRGGGVDDRSSIRSGGGESGYIAATRRTRTSSTPAATAAHHALQPQDRTAPADQSVSRQPDGLRVEGHRGALPVDVPDRLLADGSERALRRLAARLEDDQRRPELDEDQPRPHAPRSEDDGRLRRADHAGRDGRRDLRDGLHDRAVAEGRQPDLDRLRRRLRAGHARRRHRPGRT